MPTLKHIKEDLEFNQSLVNLVDVLKGIASSQFQAMKGRKERFKTFIDSFEEFFRLIDLSGPLHPFAAVGSGKLGIIIITSNEGFMGGLNTQVIKEALDYRKDKPAELIILGQKGADYLEGMNEKFTSFPGIDETNKYQLLLKLRDYIIRQRLKEEIGKVVLCYPEPVSFTYQSVRTINILPCTELFEKRKEEEMYKTKKLIIESSLDRIIEYLVTTWITHRLHEVFEDSRISEFAARAVSLEEKCQVLAQRNKVLKYRYFYNFHRLVDRSMGTTISASLLSRRQKNQI